MIITSFPVQGAIQLSDEQMKKLAKLVAEAISATGSSIGPASFPTSNSTKATVQMDESIVDVGVSLAGIEQAGSITSETTTTDNVTTATSKLKTLKGK